MELLRYQLESAESDKDLSVAQRTLQQVNLERQQHGNGTRPRRADENVAEIEKLKVRLTALQGDLENSKQNLLTIRAPYDGVVISLAQRNAGSVVQNGQELCQLARQRCKAARAPYARRSRPAEARERPARSALSSMPFLISATASSTAKLDWISPAAVASPEGPHFVALASLDDDDCTAGDSRSPCASA